MRTEIGLILAMMMSTGFAGAISNSAACADLEPMPMKAAPAATPAFNWSGVYFGVNGGGDWGHQDPFNVLTNRFARSISTTRVAAMRMRIGYITRLLASWSLAPRPT